MYMHWEILNNNNNKKQLLPLRSLLSQRDMYEKGARQAQVNPAWWALKSWRLKVTT